MECAIEYVILYCLNNGFVREAFAMLCTCKVYYSSITDYEDALKTIWLAMSCLPIAQISVVPTSFIKLTTLASRHVCWYGDELSLTIEGFIWALSISDMSCMFLLLNHKSIVYVHMNSGNAYIKRFETVYETSDGYCGHMCHPDWSAYKMIVEHNPKCIQNVCMTGFNEAIDIVRKSKLHVSKLHVSKLPKHLPSNH
jgi:hypothetical protein